MTEKKHPSYGMIKFSRSSRGGDGTALFGSSIKHNNTIHMTVCQGREERNGNEDDFFSYERTKDVLIDVEMSYTQFAEAITSLNIGSGVPVTVRKLNGEEMPESPFTDKKKQMKQEYRQATGEMVTKLREKQTVLEKLLEEKKVLNKSDKELILSTVSEVRRLLQSELPFINELFQKQLDKTVLEAKGEFESFVENKMNELARQSIAENLKTGSHVLGIETEEDPVMEQENGGMQINM